MTQTARYDLELETFFPFKFRPTTNEVTIS